MSKGINCDIIHGMKPPNNRFIRAVGTMVGSVVGVGVFGLPYAFEKSGPVLGALVLVLLAGVISGMQLMYAEVALHTPGNHRLVGYVRALLGEGWARFAVVALSAGLWGSMLAYMIVGGSFLRELFAPGVAGAEFWFGLGLAAVAGFLMSRGTQAVAKLEVAAVALLGFLFAFMTLAALPHARFAYLSGVHWDAMLVPYGVAFFALAGMGVIPEMKAVLGTAREKELPCAVLTAMSIIAGLYLAFALVVVSVLGPKTTQSAFVGLVPVLGGSFRVAASVLGSTVVLSIFSMIGVELSNTFRFDFRARKGFALFLTLFVPCALFVLGVRELIDVLMFVGSVLGGALGILVVVMYEKMRRSPVRLQHRCLNVPRLLSVAVVAVFLAGMVLTLARLFS